jgi:hypothetical protein
MQQAAESAPSPTASSFAGLLASLTSPAPKYPAPGNNLSSPGLKSTPVWNGDDLEDDVATLGYERALRAHARYKSAESSDWPFPQAATHSPLETAETALSADAVQDNQTATPPASPWSEDFEPKPGKDRNRKCASITIRMSKAECAQLRRRAAEAGLTVSAYLRSCTFEAESLRAQVKETLAELRKAGAPARQTASTTNRRSWFGWLLRFMPHRQTARRMARA